MNLKGVMAVLAIIAFVLLASVQAPAAAQGTKYLLKFMLTYLPRGFMWSVSINYSIIETNYSNVINFYLSPGVYSYIVTYFNVSSGKSLTVESGVVDLTSNYTVVIPVFNVQFQPQYLPSNVTYKVYVNNTFYVSGSGTTYMWLPNGRYSYRAVYYNSSLAVWVPLGSGHFSLFSNVSIPLPAYTVKFWVLGLPPGLMWYLVINSSVQTPYEPGNYSLRIGPGRYAYSLYVYNTTSYSTTFVKSGTFNVTSNETVIVPYPAKYLLTVTQFGLPSGTPWYLEINGTKLGPFTNSSATLSLWAGAYSYAVLYYYTPLKLNVLESAGIVYLGSNTIISLRPHFYNVTVVAFDQALGLSWELMLNRTTIINMTSSSVGTVLVPQGIYSYQVITYYAPLGTYEVATSGVLNLTSNTTLSFYAGLYTLSFSVQGALPGAEWNLYIDGRKVASSTLPTITIQLPEGNYTYYVSMYYSSLASYVNVTSGHLLVNSSEAIVIPVQSYTVTFYYPTKPPQVAWRIIVNGKTVASGSSQDLNVTLPRGTYQVEVQVTLLVPRANVTVVRALLNVSSNITLPINAPFYGVQFQPQSFPGGTWWLIVNKTVIGPLGQAGTTLYLLGGTYSVLALYYLPLFNTNVTVYSSTIAVSSSAPVVVPFTYIRAVTIRVTSLLPSVSWRLTLNGTSIGPITNGSVTVTLPSTPITYSTVFSYPGGSLVGPSGTLPSTGPVTITLQSPVSMLALTVQGLPPLGSWMLFINGTEVGNWTSSTARVYLRTGNAKYLIDFRTANLTFFGTRGNVTVNGTTQLTVALPSTYQITVRPPSGAISWSLYINGTLALGPTNASSASVYLPAGIYKYQLSVKISSGTKTYTGTIVVPTKTGISFATTSSTPTLMIVIVIVVVAVVVAALLFAVGRR